MVVWDKSARVSSEPLLLRPGSEKSRDCQLIDRQEPFHYAAASIENSAFHVLFKAGQPVMWIGELHSLLCDDSPCFGIPPEFIADAPLAVKVVRVSICDNIALVFGWN
jgi:hypothetical protein